MNDPLPLVIANLKANKTWDQISVWLDQVGNSSAVQKFSGTTIVAPSAPFLAAASQQIKSKNLPLKLAGQDVSKFEQGAYTGEYAASQIADICQFCIVGHSERRQNFGETNKDVTTKVKLLLENRIIPVLCISELKQLDSYLNQEETISQNASEIIFVYEPVSAISDGGTYHPQTPTDANKNTSLIKKKFGQKVTTIYGGSINPDNVSALFVQKNIDGGLIGQASVDPKIFIKVIKNSTIR